MRISDWSSDVCSSDLDAVGVLRLDTVALRIEDREIGEIDVVGGHEQPLARPLLASEIQDRSGAVLRPLAAHGDIVNIESEEEHNYSLQSLMRTSYTVFCVKKKSKQHNPERTSTAY